MWPTTDTDAECRKHAEHNRRLIRRWLRDRFMFRGVRVFDVGAGIGHVTTVVREGVPQAQICCFEPEPRASSWLKSQGFKVVDSFAGVEPADAILLIEVVEHVDDPVGLLRECKQVLAKGGRVFLTTPCGETPKGYRPMGGYIIPEHIHFFTERSLRLACQRAGFSDISFIGSDVMHPRGEGLNYAISFAKSALRPLRDFMTGRQSLIGYVA